MKRKVLIALSLAIVLSQQIKATSPSIIYPVGQEEFRPVSFPPVILEPLPIAKVKPEIIEVAPEPKIVVKSTPKPVVSKQPVSIHTSHTVNGVASWYCRAGISRCTSGHSGGMYAAIRKDLLFLRGKVVTISYGTKSIRVTIIDCNCGPHANLIDLYSDAFRKLTPLKAGEIKVIMKW